MTFDRVLARGALTRHATPVGARLLHDAWLGMPWSERAPLALASGDAITAGALAGGGWQLLANGDRIGALQAARGGERAPGDRLLEAEAMMASGAVVAGLAVLETLLEGAYAPAAVSLARHRNALGDYRRAMQVAASMPQHAAVALTGARAALTLKRPADAFDFLEPILHGVAPIPDAATAGAAAVVTASALAQTGRHDRLRAFAHLMLDAPDLVDEMLPAIARVAWTAGRAADAWKRCDGKSAFSAAARLELAVLAGDVAAASRMMREAGMLAAPAEMAVRLLQGNFDLDEGGKIFNEGVLIHVWRTHPHRWQPWINAALETPADIGVFELGRDDLPPATEVPHAVLDDGSLAEMLAPKIVPARPPQGEGVWIDDDLGGMNGVGHRWPDAEVEALRAAVPCQPAPERSAVRVAGEDFALRTAPAGAPTIVVAPPGDPFWNGELPARAWPAMRIVRIDSRRGWEGVGRRVAELAHELAPLGGGASAAASAAANRDEPPAPPPDE